MRPIQQRIGWLHIHSFISKGSFQSECPVGGWCLQGCSVKLKSLFNDEAEAFLQHSVSCEVYYVNSSQKDE